MNHLHSGVGEVSALNSAHVPYPPHPMLKSQPSPSRHLLASVAFSVVGCLMGTHSQADVVTADDAIIQGSLGVGIDAVNNESFGFDSIRLKENNTRISFIDTSSSSGFPANDWSIVANDSASGGRNYLGFRDKGADGDGSETGTLSFYIMAGAAENSLMVDSSSRVGLGTASPALKLHLNQTDTPAIRLEQTNGGGFTAQTWDVAGNEANFFVRDVTGGSLLPFRIRPGAPTSSLDISANGFVGLGKAGANAKLHVALTSSDVTDKDGVLIAPSTYTPPGGGAPVFTLHVEGTAFVSQTLEIGSSRERKENIKDLELKDAEETLHELNPVHFNYKSDTQHQLGFIAEDVPDLVATESRKSLVPMSFIAVLTKVTQEHERKVEALEKTVAAQSDLIKAMAARLDALEKGNSSAKTVSLPVPGQRETERRKKQDSLDVASAPQPASGAAGIQSTPPASRPEVINNGR